MTIAVEKIADVSETKVAEEVKPAEETPKVEEAKPVEQVKAVEKPQRGAGRYIIVTSRLVSQPQHHPSAHRPQRAADESP